MMKRLTAYLGLALAACLSCLSLSAFAEPLSSAYRVAYVTAEPQDVGLKRLELTLAMWRADGQTADDSLAANLRASSNHFVMEAAKPAHDGVGLTPC